MAVEFLNRHSSTSRGEGQFRRNVAEDGTVGPGPGFADPLQGAENQIIWRGDRRPMMLKVTPYSIHAVVDYSADTRYPEKWNRQIWRSASEAVSPAKHTDKPVLSAAKTAAKPAQPVAVQLGRKVS